MSQKIGSTPVYDYSDSISKPVNGSAVFDDPTPLAPVGVSPWDEKTKTLTVNGTSISICSLRDTLIRLREENVYCVDCHSPSWVGKHKHFTDCHIGRLLEDLLKIAPKPDVVVRWKQEQ